MDAVLQETLWRWEWRPEVVLVLAGMGTVYSLGWARLARQGRRRLANGWRLAAFWGGLLALALALLSPIDALQPLLFTMHMVQHELLMMVAAPLVMLSAPLPFLLWGLPASWRGEVAGLLVRGGILRRLLQRVATPRLAWLVYVGVLWVWHSPAAYNAALRSAPLHDLEHLSFFWAALLFWWHVTGVGPRLHGPLGYGFRIAYVLAALLQNEVLGVSIAFAREPIYTYYLTVPRIWGLSVMEDQMLGGEVMWIFGGMMYVVTAIILLARLLSWEERQVRRQEAAEARRGFSTP